MFFISWFFTIFPTTSFKLNYYFTYAKNYQSLDYNDFNYNYWKKEVRLSRIGRRSTTRHRNYYQSYLGTYIQMRKKRSEGSVSSNWFFDNFENQFTVERNKVLNSFGESWQRQFPSYRRPTKSLIESVLYERRHRQLLIRSAILENLESRRWLHKKSFRKKKHKLYLEVFGKMYSEDYLRDPNNYFKGRERQLTVENLDWLKKTGHRSSRVSRSARYNFGFVRAVPKKIFFINGPYSANNLVVLDQF